MKNNKVKQMICSILGTKMNNADDKLHYDFEFISGALGFWVNRIGPITNPPKFGVISLTANQLNGIK